MQTFHHCLKIFSSFSRFPFLFLSHSQLMNHSDYLTSLLIVFVFVLVQQRMLMLKLVPALRLYPLMSIIPHPAPLSSLALLTFFWKIVKELFLALSVCQGPPPCLV